MHLMHVTAFIIVFMTVSKVKAKIILKPVNQTQGKHQKPRIFLEGENYSQK